MKEKVAFSIGTGSFLGIALVIDGVAQVQEGPDWEIPARAATNWFLIGVISVLLYCVGALGYFRGNRFRSLVLASRKAFWLLLCFGILVTVLSYVLDTGQWKITHPVLSGAARASSFSISVICGILWILLSVSVNRSAQVGPREGNASTR
jgi:magnesium-transporting ATPase (P-type)